LKYGLLFILAFLASSLKAQSVLQFDKLFIVSEDKWVAFPMEKDSSYIYGFIYIDPHAGLSLHYDGSFKISKTGDFEPKKLDSTSVKVRLKPNNVRVAFIPENKFKELNISATPEWLKYYKTDTSSVERLYNWGYMYNAWGKCAKGLTYLEKAQQTNPNFKDLAVELAFSYNCLRQFNKAILVLQNAIKSDPTNAYINKELIYAQINSGQIEKAIESYKKAIVTCIDQTYNGENCYNVLQFYYAKRDKANFDLWVSDAKKWTATNEALTKNILAMEDSFK